MAEEELEQWREVGRRLGTARKAMHLSKREAARRAQFSEGQWRVLEAGERTVAKDIVVAVSPRDDTLVAAARAVGLDPAPLFTVVGRDYASPMTEPVELSAHGVDLNRLAVERPDLYAAMQTMAKAALGIDD